MRESPALACAWTCVLFVLISMLAAPSNARAQSLYLDPFGIGRFAADGFRQLPIQAAVLVFQDQWQKNTGQWALQDRQFSRTQDGVASTLVQTGYFEVQGQRIDFRQNTTTLAADGSTTVNFEFTAPDAIENISAICLSLDFSAAHYSDWTFALDDSPAIGRPPQFEKKQLFSKDQTRRVVARAPDGERSIEFVLGPASSATIQDARAWNGSEVNVMVTIHAGCLPANTPIVFSYKVIARIPADTSPASITVDPGKVLNRFDGLGGNFVYAFDHPITQLNLKSLQLTWARAGMEMNLWAPSATTFGPQNDRPGTLLRKRFELDQQLMELTQGRLIMSIWRAPEWLYDKPIPLSVWREHASPISRDKWPVLAQAIGGYLSHLKDQYGVEPALFSFNENDLGIYVKLSADEHRDMMKLLGEEFARRGLKTKQLAGDSAYLKLGIEQIEPTLNDPAAMKYVNALAYHPWGTERDFWDDWADAARKVNLPLLATEMGSDAGGYRDASYNLPRPTFQLAHKYVDMIANARVQALLEWEWTNDYPTYDTADGKHVASRRHAVLWQLSQLSPQFSQVVSTTTNRADTPAAALRKDGQITLHVVNRDEARLLNVSGLPADLQVLHLTLTTKDESASYRGTINLTGGQFTFDAPAQSMLTFTTTPPPTYKTALE